MNKRGDITITILVLGVLAICFLALISFYMADLDTSDTFDGIRLIEKVLIKDEQGEAKETDFTGRNYFKETKGIFEVIYSP